MTTSRSRAVDNGPGGMPIGHFRVLKTLTFKMRPSAQSFLWKWVLFAWEWNIISISKAEHLTSFWYRGPGELGNGLFLAQYFGKLPASTFESLLGFREFFPLFVSHFFKRAREHEVKLRHVLYEVWLVTSWSRKWIITSIGQSKHMRVTRFNPLWDSCAM